MPTPCTPPSEKSPLGQGSPDCDVFFFYIFQYGTGGFLEKLPREKWDCSVTRAPDLDEIVLSSTAPPAGKCGEGIWELQEARFLGPILPSQE